MTSITILPASSFLNQPKLVSVSKSLISSSTNPFVMYQSAEWMDYLVSSPHTANTFVALIHHGNSVSGIVPFHIGTYRLTSAIRHIAFIRTPLRTLFLLGSEPLIPRDVGTFSLLIIKLFREFPEIEGLYLKSIQLESFCTKCLTKDSVLTREFLVHDLDGTRDFHLLKIPATFDEYLSQFRRKKRYNLKRQLRMLEQHCAGELELLRVEHPDQVHLYVKQVSKMLGRTWQGRLIDKKITDFILSSQALLRLARNKLLRSYLLRCGSNYCAFVHGYQYENRIYHYADIGYDQRYARFSPGAVLWLLLVKDLIDHNPPESVIFGVGDSEYKSQFGSHHSRDCSFLILRRCALNRAYVMAHKLSEHLRRSGKKLAMKLIK